MTVRIEKPALNLREEINRLDKPSGIAGEAMLRAETPQEQFNLIGAGRRNLLINGGFQISQRGDYSSATSASTASYYLDRWNMDISTVTTTIQNNSDADLPNGITVKTAKVAATSSATGYMQIRQKIEVEDWMDNRVYTLSAWVKSNTPYPRLRIESAGPTLGNIDSEQTHSGSGNWEYLTMTFTSGNSIVNFNAGVIDWAGNATRAITSGDYFEVANIQLELGKVATPFEHRSYGEELALCQRYYHTLRSGIIGVGTSVGSVAFTYSSPVTMRATPTIGFKDSNDDIRVGDMVAQGHTINTCTIGTTTYSSVESQSWSISGTPSAPQSGNLTPYRTYLLEPQYSNHGTITFSSEL